MTFVPKQLGRAEENTPVYYAELKHNKMQNNDCKYTSLLKNEIETVCTRSFYHFYLSLRQLPSRSTKCGAYGFFMTYSILSEWALCVVKKDVKTFCGGSKISCFCSLDIQFLWELAAWFSCWRFAREQCAEVIHILIRIWRLVKFSYSVLCSDNLGCFFLSRF